MELYHCDHNSLELCKQLTVNLLLLFVLKLNSVFSFVWCLVVCFDRWRWWKFLKNWWPKVSYQFGERNLALIHHPKRTEPTCFFHLGRIQLGSHFESQYTYTKMLEFNSSITKTLNQIESLTPLYIAYFLVHQISRVVSWCPYGKYVIQVQTMYVDERIFDLM